MLSWSDLRGSFELAVNVFAVSVATSQWIKGTMTENGKYDKKKKKIMHLFYDLQIVPAARHNLDEKMKGYYHVCSHGLEKNDIFKKSEDFITGMNDIAICILGFDVSILCFCLMSNHFHFLLYGTAEECMRFSQEYKRRCSIRMRGAGDVQALREVEIHVDRVDAQEYLENVIAYILRNPIAAGIHMMPYHYPWSSISLYFNGGKIYEGVRLNGMSERKRFRVLKSRSDVPDAYMVDEYGMILTSCYVNAEFVEKVFRHPARLMAALARKIEVDVELRLGLAENVSMTDQEILTQTNELIMKEFRKESISQLSMEQRLRLCYLMKKNFRAGVKQISRITRLDPDVVSKIV